MDVIPAAVLEKVTELRHELHARPAASGHEEETAALLKAFLKRHTPLELHDCGRGFYAAYRVPDSAAPGVALRADYDALLLPDGTAAHLCGHDGHAAALCGVAMLLDAMRVGRNVFLLFQPAEETGRGAETCVQLFDREQVGEIYGAHNLPGYPLGQVYTRPGTFACASRGLAVTLEGFSAHAAYPEEGRSPAGALGELLCRLSAFAQGQSPDPDTFCTIIGARLGEEAFGTTPARAELWLTLRAQKDGALMALQRQVEQLVAEAAQAHGLSCAVEIRDPFPATVNDPDCAEKICAACAGALLRQPMRWSEDFGHYLNRCRGAFFGIGAGDAQPPLHSSLYSYPDALLEPTIRAFCQLLRCGA
ncbi:MAG: amidohydrolase [Oscillospiraceae bacterium]